jgi:hypothetical protein
MIILYDIVEHKTDIKGFWKEENILFKDNIILKESYADYKFLREKRKLFIEKNQIAVFYKEGDFAFIESKEGKIEKLTNVKRFYFEKLRPSQFKALLKKYNGFTVYKRKNYFMIEIWES